MCGHFSQTARSTFEAGKFKKKNYKNNKKKRILKPNLKEQRSKWSTFKINFLNAAHCSCEKKIGSDFEKTVHLFLNELSLFILFSG